MLTVPEGDTTHTVTFAASGQPCRVLSPLASSLRMQLVKDSFETGWGGATVETWHDVSEHGVDLVERTGNVVPIAAAGSMDECVAPACTLLRS